jgi:hypothetical protein
MAVRAQEREVTQRCCGRAGDAQRVAVMALDAVPASIAVGDLEVGAARLTSHVTERLPHVRDLLAAGARVPFADEVPALEGARRR